jgi:hypothetical protein
MRAIAVLWTTLLVGGCATTPVEEMGAAFGRVQYLENGKEVGLTVGFFKQDSARLIVRRVGGDAQAVPIEGDGAFYLPLPVGEYVFVAYRRGSQVAGRSSETTYRVMAAFSVAKAQAVYIGDLRVDRVGKAARIGIVDREDDAREGLAPRLAEAKLTLAKGLMRPEQPPGRFSRVTAICGGSWGIQCEGNHHGVRQLEPGAFALPLDSVTPLLEWTPSSRSDVTYDVAIHERLDLGVRGAVLVYAEGLSRPRYTPPALERGQRYEWSVRLRDGDTVSTWSTTGHSAYFPVILPGVFVGGFGGSGSAQYFSFEILK